MNRGGAEGPLRINVRQRWFEDVYHRLLVMRWPWFLLLGGTVYLAINVLFALAYWAVPGSIDHAGPQSFADHFFFSIQTMATIGYGVLTPATFYANSVVTVETMVSLVFTAFTTGIIFARFSRPTARVNFSKYATVARHNGVPTLFMRLSNARRNQILEAEVTVVLLRNEVSEEGGELRRFYDLALSRGHTPIFSLTFTVMHPITPTSPLHGMTHELLAAEDVELLVAVTGLDETMGQTVHARYSYSAEEILFGRRFRDMFGFTAEGRLVIDHSLMDIVEEAPL